MVIKIDKGKISLEKNGKDLIDSLENNGKAKLKNSCWSGNSFEPVGHPLHKFDQDDDDVDQDDHEDEHDNEDQDQDVEDDDNHDHEDDHEGDEYDDDDLYQGSQLWVVVIKALSCNCVPERWHPSWGW